MIAASGSNRSVKGFPAFIPGLITFVFAIFMLLPIGSGVSGVTMPHLALISTFYWVSYRPMLMPYGLCAAIGLLLDLWLGVPLGLNMLLLLLVRVFVLNQLKHYRGRSAFLYWAVFALMGLGLYTLSWILTSVIAWQLYPVEGVLVQWAITTFAYAPLVMILGRFRSAVV